MRKQKSMFGFLISIRYQLEFQSWGDLVELILAFCIFSLIASEGKDVKVDGVLVELVGRKTSTDFEEKRIVVGNLELSSGMLLEARSSSRFLLFGDA